MTVASSGHVTTQRLGEGKRPEAKDRTSAIKMLLDRNHEFALGNEDILWNIHREGLP